MKLRQLILGTLLASCTHSLSAANNFVVNTQNREEVRNFFNTVYQASEEVPMGWAGDVGQCQAGTLSPDYIDAVALRINFFRALAGIPANVILDAEYNRKAQLGALMMSANKTIDHNPPSTWLCYTAEGAEAAGSANLSIGSAGPQAVSGLIADGGDNNTAVGHRRWTLYPTTQMMGIGSISSSDSYPATAVLWVFDTPSWNTPRPATRNDFVSWPPSGFVPYSLAFPRWSVSYPEADFSQATVTMQTQGVTVPLQLEPLSQGFGENTLVWVPNITLETAPATDTSYSVSVNNVKVEGAPRSFNYTVTVFDPMQLGPDSVFPVISGNDQPVVNRENVYTFNAVPNATSYQLSQASRIPFVQVEDAESGVANFQVNTSSSYDVITTDAKANGTSSFHLAHPEHRDQTLTLKHTLLPTGQGMLAFSSRLGLSSTEQVARVQLSTDEGKTWRDIFTQAGTASGTTSSFGEESFTEKTISLVEWAGKAIQVRFNYTVQGTSYSQTTAGVGWYIDDIRFANTEELTQATLTELPPGLSFNFKPSVGGWYALQVRAKVYDKYPLEWGPVKQLTAQEGGTVTNQPPVAKFTVSTLQGAAPLTVNFNANDSYDPDGTIREYEWTAKGAAMAAVDATTTHTFNVPGDYTVILTVTDDKGESAQTSQTVQVHCSANSCLYPAVWLDKVGFYIARVRLGQGRQEGFWGLEVNTSRGSNAYGFNAGAVLKENGSENGFIGFYLAAPEKVKLKVEEYSKQVTQLRVVVQRQDSNTLERTIVYGPNFFKSGDHDVTEELGPGFYIASTASRDGDSRGRFGIELLGNNFVDGVNLGGWIDNTTGETGEGFGAFYITSPQDVKLNLLFGDNYDAKGAGPLTLTILRQNPITGEQELYWGPTVP